MAKYRPYWLSLLLLQVVDAQGPFSISTFAGSNGPPALAASGLLIHLASVEGIAVDAAGNVYVADAPEHRVWRLRRNGEMELMAGNGEGGYNADGIAAVTARLNTPYGLALDNAGNLYIADLGNARIRRVSPDGMISTVAGGGPNEPNLFGAPMPGREARLSAPRNVAFDGTHVYFSDFGAHRVYRLAPSDGTLTHFAGAREAGSAQDNVPALLAPLRAPTAIAVDRGGAIYVADSGNNAIRRILRGNMQRVTSTGGAAARVSFGTVTGLAIGANGDMFVAEPGSPLRRISAAGIVAQFPNSGRDVAVDGDAVLLADGGQVRRFSGAGAEVIAGSGGFSFFGDGGSATNARLRNPTALAVDAIGNLYIADTANHRIRRVNRDGRIDTVASTPLNNPAGVAVDASGMVWISDTGNGAVRRLLLNGTLETWATGLRRPMGIAFDRTGVPVVAEAGAHRVVRLPVANRVEALAGNGQAGGLGDGNTALQAQLNTPTDVEFDRNGVLHICDSGNRRIRRVVNGVMQSYPSAGLREPVAIALDRDGLYVADAGANRIAWLAASGARIELAGRGTAGFEGEGTPAADALLNRPMDVVLAPSGSLFIADQENHLVRRLTPGSGGVVIGESRVITLASSANGRESVAVPGALMTIFGAGLGPLVGVAGRMNIMGRLETRLDGVEVRFDGLPAPLLWVQESQINLQVPMALHGRVRTTIEIEVAGVIRTRFQTEVEDVTPALFLFGDGSGQVLAQNQDGSMNAEGNGAGRGEALVLFATGTGIWDRPVADGFPAGDPLPRPRVPVTVEIGERTAEVRWVGGAPGLVGIVQLNVVVPEGPGAGRIPVTLRAGGVASAAGPFVTVR